MAHFDDGLPVRANGREFNRTNDGVIIATEEDYISLFASLGDKGEEIRNELATFLEKLHRELKCSFDEMMIVRYIMVPVARETVEIELQRELNSLRAQLKTSQDSRPKPRAKATKTQESESDDA